MQASTQNSNALHIIGIKTRTTNAEEMQGAGKISSLWGKFFADGILSKVPSALNQNIIGVYHDYESDASGPYSLLLGVQVAAGTVAPEGMELLQIPAHMQKYTVFTTRKGQMPDVVIEAWQTVWELSAKSELQRAYTYDLEIYDKRAVDPQACEVDLLIAIK